MIDFIEEHLKKEIILLPMGDTHTGSTTALHPNVRKIDGKWVPIVELQGWSYMHNNHYYLTSKQVKLWNHLNACLPAISALRKNKKLVMLMVGDAVEGVHHGTHEVVTRNISEQCSTHIELMQYIQEEIDYQRGDMLAYIAGTEVHVGDEESGIAKELGAYQYPSGFYSTSFLKMELNGALVWAFHQGVRAGKVPNRGNGAVNLMKGIHLECKMNNERVPDLIISGHTHDADHFTYTQQNHTMHYVIVPPWQNKTRYVQQKMATSNTRVGFQVIRISIEGKIEVLDPMLSTEILGDTIVV